MIRKTPPLYERRMAGKPVGKMAYEFYRFTSEFRSWFPVLGWIQFPIVPRSGQHVHEYQAAQSARWWQIRSDLPERQSRCHYL